MNYCTRALTTLALLSALPVTAQGPAPGFRVYGPHGTTDTWMVDNNNNVVHTWPGSFNPGNGIYLDKDGTLLRSTQLAGRPSIGGAGGGVQRIAFDGTLLWNYDYASSTGWAHHDMAVLPNGNVLMIVWDLMTQAQAFAAGRNPAFLSSTEWLPDAIIEVKQTGATTGDIVWEWHMMDHVIQEFDSSQANFGVVVDHPELLDINFPPEDRTNGEWNHSNAIAYDPVNDLVVLSSPYQNEFWLIDHSTTTTEAAGHTGGNYGVGGDFVYRWGNPLAYQAGTALDQRLYFQHGTHVIPEGLAGAGNVLCFNNRAGEAVGQTFSTVVEIDIPSVFTPPSSGSAYGPTNFVWEYMDPVPTSLYSSGLSNAERLPNGNTLVCSGRQAWFFEIDSSGQKVWEFFPPVPASPGIVFQVSYYERYLWADQESISAAAGGTVTFNMVGGTANQSNAYLMLGSASGTSPGFTYGINVPLNPDGYLSTTLALAGTGLPSFLGILDAMGNGSASLTLPSIPALSGLTLNHAFVAIDGTGSLTLASNPVPLTFTP